MKKEKIALMLLQTVFMGCPLLVMGQQDFDPGYVYYHANNVPETPNAATFTIYGDIPVNHATGVPQINVPLFELVEDGVSIPISISYHASGVKVDDLASVVGLKWTLNTGGGIYRQVNDKPDEIGWLIPNQRGIVTPAWLASNAGLEDQYVQQEINQSSRDDDYYPDDFSYNFPGQSGGFILNQNGSVEEEHESILKIQRIPGTGQNFYFDVLDGYGNSYHFDNKQEFNSKNVHVGGTTGEQLNFNKDSYLTGWPINNITTKNNKQINFTYIPYVLDYSLNNVSHSISYVEECISEPNQFGSACGCEGSGDGYNTNVLTTSISYSSFNQLANTIESENVRVSFNYTDDASLSTWKKRLDSITILDKITNKTKSFVFTYGKFPGDPRLRLDQVQEIGFDGTSKPSHKFYYETGNLPSKGSMAKDYHGYYNGKKNNSLVPFSAMAYSTLTSTYRSYLADRNEDANHLKKGVLNKIEYPTGGSTEFTYEPNAVPAILNRNPSYSTKAANVSNQLASYSVTSGRNTFFRTPFTIMGDLLGTQGTPVSYSGSSNICAYDSDFPNIDCSRFNIYPRSGNSINGPGVLNPSKVIWAEGNVHLPAGDYMLEIVVKTADLNTNPNALIRAELGWTGEDSLSEQTHYSGGLRTKSIVDRDANGKISKRADYSYDGLNGYSLDVGHTMKNYGDKLSFSAENLSQNPNLIKSGYFYDTVTIDKIGARNDRIRTVEKYEEIFLNKSYTSHMVRQEMYRGEEMVKSIDMDYTNTITKTQQFWVLGDKDFCYTIYGLPSPKSLYLGYNNPDSQSYYHRRNILAQRTEIDYLNTIGEPFSCAVKIRKFQYNENLLPTKDELDGRYYATSQQNLNNGILFFVAEGEHMTVDYTYPDDHAGGDSAVDMMISEYLIGYPVSKKVHNHTNMVLGQFTRYDIHGNVLATYQYNKGAGSNNSTAGHIPSNYGLHTEYTLLNGRPVEVKRNNGPTTALLWDASGTYLLAKIANASHAQIVTLGINPTATGLTTAQEDSLRALPNTQVTTYAYAPLVGITRMTDPKDYTATYCYDGLNRLEEVRDSNNDLVTDYEYHYKNQ